MSHTNLAEPASSEPIELKTPAIPAQPTVRTAALTLLAVFASIAFLRYAQTVLVPIVLSVFISYCFYPLVSLMDRMKIPRFLSAMIAIIVLIAGLSVAAYELRPHAIAAIETVPKVMRELRRAFQYGELSSKSKDSVVGKLKEAATEIDKTAEAASEDPPPQPGVRRVQVDEPAFQASRMLLTGSVSVAVMAGQAGVILFFVYFLLASGDLFKRKIVRLGGRRLSEKKMTVETLHEINIQIERFMLLRIATCAMVGLLTFLMLLWFGIENAVIWSILAGAANLIPYFGPVAATTGIAMVSFVQLGSVWEAATVAGVALIITSVEGMLITPMLMGRAASINQVVMFFGLLFWGWLWGIVGAILAVPIMMVTKIVCDRLEGFQPVGEFLSEK